MGFCPARKRIVAIVGGGPSAADSLDDIKALDADIIALNGASKWLRSHGVKPKYQCIIDARPENIGLLDKKTPKHLLASQVSPNVVESAGNVTIMHLASKNCEDHLPEVRKARGGYALIGGGYGVGNSAICAAYVMGYRTMHCFGFDSSHRNGKGHAYSQPINDGIECVKTKFNGKTYVSSLPMKAHADRFMVISNDLMKMGCKVHVHGDGLLPAMFNSRTPSEGTDNG